MVDQIGLWDKEPRIKKLQAKRPALKRLTDSIPWESFRPLLDQGYAQECNSNANARELVL
jgi:hypothetical protein